MDSPSKMITHRPDNFKCPRIKAIQPSMAVDDLAAGLMQSEDPIVISYLTNLLRVWSFDRNDLPPDFVDEVRITNLMRQPTTILKVEAELKRVTLEANEKPFQGQTVNGNRWTSKDPYEVRSVKIEEFPDTEKVESFLVPGEESVAACKTCRSAGEIPCGGCVNGQTYCSECSGGGRITCSRCAGGGYHVGARGNMIQCQLCNTIGTVRCTRCDRGRVTCGNCSGRGLLICDRCKGSGNLHNYWVQRIETKTTFDTLSVMDQTWPIEAQLLAADSTVFYKVCWKWPLQTIPEFERDLKVPASIQEPINSEITSRLRRTAQTLDKHSRISALRVTISGAFFYRVDYEYYDKKVHIFVGGHSNRIFIESGHDKGNRLLQGIRRLGYNFSNSVCNYRPPVDRNFLKAVKQGTVHIADTRCLLPALGKDTSLVIAISEVGYLVSLKSLGPQTLEISFDFDIFGRVILILEKQLGPADRSRFAKAMELNRKLSFGRLAITTRDGQEKFLLTDRRIYSTAQPQHLAKIIRCMLVESTKLSEAGF